MIIFILKQSVSLTFYYLCLLLKVHGEGHQMSRILPQSSSLSQNFRFLLNGKTLLIHLAVMDLMLNKTAI